MMQGRMYNTQKAAEIESEICGISGQNWRVEKQDSSAVCERQPRHQLVERVPSVGRGVTYEDQQSHKVPQHPEHKLQDRRDRRFPN